MCEEREESEDEKSHSATCRGWMTGESPSSSVWQSEIRVKGVRRWFVSTLNNRQLLGDDRGLYPDATRAV